jgi:peptidoglycan lytic transglycosylase
MRRHRALPLIALAALLGTQGCGLGGRHGGDTGRPGWSERGYASWYGPQFHGRRTANGEVYDMNAMTAAHRELPFGTVVEVRNLDNGRRVQVRINDRGPFVRGRIIDLSRAAAEAIDMIGSGTARVELRARLDRPVRPAGRFTVQVGAFRDRDRALDLAAGLRRHYEVEVQGVGLWHRVRVGGARDRGAAKRLAGELRRRGYDAVVVTVD